MRNSICLSFLIIVLSLTGCDWIKRQIWGNDRAAAIGTIAPDFTLKTENNTVHALVDYKGKVVVLNFWASWCGPCRKEMPSLFRLQQKVRANDVIVIAVSDDENWNPVKTFLGTQINDLLVLLDTADVPASLYGVTGYPETFIIDKRGIIRDHVLGDAQWDSDVWITMLTQMAHE